jgi:hypothetical protein
MPLPLPGIQPPFLDRLALSLVSMSIERSRLLQGPVQTWRLVHWTSLREKLSGYSGIVNPSSHLEPPGSSPCLEEHASGLEETVNRSIQFLYSIHHLFKMNFSIILSYTSRPPKLPFQGIIVRYCCCFRVVILAPYRAVAGTPECKCSGLVTSRKTILINTPAWQVLT